jgi:purine-nucleoside/S-methyl-5'-thioadenosine phosphorylase / adenosine deaminase
MKISSSDKRETDLVSPLMIPQLERLPFLRHGFGDASWGEKDLRRFAVSQGLTPIFLNQVHSDVIRSIDDMPRRILRGDAAVTHRPGVLLAIRTADCLPVLLVEEKRRVVAAVHCGWKGTAKRILEKVVLGMEERYGADPAALLAAFGPGIGADCYEVGEDVHAVFMNSGFPGSLFRPAAGRAGRHLFDLSAANRLQLLKHGVKASHIFSIDICTHCDARYPSYRRDRDASGRMLSFIGLTA